MANYLHFFCFCFVCKRYLNFCFSAVNYLFIILPVKQLFLFLVFLFFVYFIGYWFLKNLHPFNTIHRMCSSFFFSSVLRIVVVFSDHHLYESSSLSSKTVVRAEKKTSRSVVVFFSQTQRSNNNKNCQFYLAQLKEKKFHPKTSFEWNSSS